MIAQIFDSRQCTLGEGPLWHPVRKQLLWFDILEKKLLSRHNHGLLEWQFDEYVSAAGWVDEDNLLIASQTKLFKFNLVTNESTHVCDLEIDNSVTRSNDGRADPFGGFWIGTMGIACEPKAGAIYRYYKGELRKLFSDITVTNCICFSPDGKFGYFTDSLIKHVMRQPLDEAGWPKGEASIYLDLSAESFGPDGAVIDSEGAMWNAQWGASRVARYLPDGTLDFTIAIGGIQATCPAFGGDDFTDLYVTSALENIKEPNEDQGATFLIQTDLKQKNICGQKEHQVIL